MNFPLPRLYAIINASRAEGPPPSEVGAKLLDAGVRLIQFRSKRAPTRETYFEGLQLAALVRRAGGILIINDRADLARALEAHGVHVGQDDLPVEMARRILGPDKIVGVSTHSPEQVREADRSSADYIAFGPIFQTRSKERPDPVVGLDGLRRARSLTPKPLVAIGGISLARARQAIEAGADSVSVIGDLLAAPDVGERAREFLKALDEN
jgi:thiamine-phosphate pyrophosphorylase